MIETDAAFFLDYSATVRQEVDSALAACIQFGPGCPEHLQQAMEHSLLGPGKRLRPLLVLLATEACGSLRSRAMPAACAVEMVHAYSLIHDDLPAMDDDDLRRGRPSCHAAFGEATAILAGDALLARAFEIIVGELQPAAVAVACCQELSKAAGATMLVGGQQDDLAAEFSSGGLDQLESIHARKTGALIQTSLRLGGLIAEQGDEPLQALTTYGTKLGLAFQIVDDLLDADGNQTTVGKRTGKDAGRGKLTFPGLLDVEESRRRAVELINQACQALAPFGSNAEGLEALARYVAERNH